jgi:hypothetical protein
MSTPHKAKPVDWVVVEESGSRFSSTDSCLLELRARVEALEADGPAVPSREPTSASSLVERVAIALAESDHPHQLWHDEARAAIREVAAWLRDRADHWSWVAQVLEREAGR